MSKEAVLMKMYDENCTPDSLEYLTVVCSSRSKAVAAKARILIRNGNYGAAIKCADPIRFNTALNEL